MIDDGTVETILRHVFAQPDENVYAIVDGASAEHLMDHLYSDGVDHFCLFEGNLDPDVQAVAPYLVPLKADHAFTDWLVREGWGNHWGIFLGSRLDSRRMRNHLRGLVRVENPAGKVVIFRYYDPRILRVYLPTCTAAEADQFFGPVRFFAGECADPNVLLTFFPRANGVRQEAIKLVNG